MIDGSDVLVGVCAAIDAERKDDAAAILARDYPFVPLKNVGRRYSALQAMRVFARDGFIDRYTGRRLIFPGTLRLLSKFFPIEFPYHRNWRTDACHFAFWELSATVDHLVPISRGGADNEGNWVSTSMLRNAAKANFTIEELGWKLLPCGDIDAWDGLTRWFLRHIEDEFCRSPELRPWTEAAKRTLGDTG